MIHTIEMTDVLTFFLPKGGDLLLGLWSVLTPEKILFIFQTALVNKLQNFKGCGIMGAYRKSFVMSTLYSWSPDVRRRINTILHNKH